MKHYFQLSLLAIASTLITNMVFANTLSSEAQNRGINSTCSSYLSQLEGIYDLDGLNLTFAYPGEPSVYPTLHSSTKKYNNGATIFSATLSPYDEYCYLSTVSVTIINVSDQAISFELLSLRKNLFQLQRVPIDNSHFQGS